jgi:hypothetical protein
MKRHFTSSYDYFKYNGKVNARVDAFENRKDKFFFFKLAKRKDYKEFLLANMINNPNVWVGDLVDDDTANETFMNWSKRQQSLGYMFSNELDELDEDFNSNFVVEDGQYPRVLSLYNMKRISIETLVILSDLTGCFKYWDKSINDTIVYPSINNIVSKYGPFLNYDKVKMREICIDKYNAV